ncbi:ATP-binding protein [Thermoanaerobacterium sp. DL9XJH110]|uniref:ATP-binding protein n=1 Tax=Thermoanaerobacterium sp. DL9XJH110 TaxID=3386643 RepID=UPI003BB4B04D
MLKVDKNKCTGDQVCTTVCSTGAARMTDSGKAEISPDMCVECYACINVCPQEAIYEVIEKKD